jgi:hypothetical protein
MQRPSRPITVRHLKAFGPLLIVLAFAALLLPVSGASGAGAGGVAAQIKSCKRRFAGKKNRKAEKRCVRRAKSVAGHRAHSPAPVSPTRAQPDPTGAAPSAGGALPEAPVPPAPEAPAPIQATAPAVEVAVGSVVDVPAPTPLVSVSELQGQVEGAAPGVNVEVDEGGLAVSASAAAATGATTLTMTGTACTASACGRAFTVQLPVTVTPIAAAAGQLENFAQPSSDRVAEAVENELQDELLIIVGTATQPGIRAQAEAAAAAVGGLVSGGLSEEGIYQVRWATSQDLTTRISELESQPGVSSVSPSTVGLTGTQTAYAPIVAQSYDQSYWTWRYDQVHAQQAWQMSTGSNITVGVVDEGDAFAGSPDLDVSKTLNAITVPGAHATNVAGLACGKAQGGGMAGLAWGCPIVTSYVESTAGDVTETSTMEAMQRVASTSGVRVVNISMGAPSRCANQAYREKIEAWITWLKPFFRAILEEAGSNIVWTFSAGNNCMSGPSSPWAANSDLPNVIDVAATNSDRRLASFSNYDVAVAAPGGVEPEAPPIDLHASCEGDQILAAGHCGLLSSTVAACPSGYCAERGEMAGTSMAAPVVAGIAALVTEEKPSLTAAEVAGCITSTAGTGGVGSSGPPDGQPGGIYLDPPLSYSGDPIPIVNAAAAVECALPTAEEPGLPAGPEVVSVGYDGVARTGHNPRISRDGRFVWFESEDNLVPGVRLEKTAVYVRDLDTKTTRRIDLPGVNRESGEELLAISPSGRYGLVNNNGSIPYLVDRQTNTITQVPRYLGRSYELGLEDDGDTVLKLASGPAPGSMRGNVADLYSISKDQWTSIPCPIERYNREGFVMVNLDNDGFAAVSSLGCRALASGYEINLATNSVSEVIPGLCNNGGNACVESIATNETGSAFVASLCCAILHGEDSLDFDGLNLATSPNIEACGVSESGRYAIYSSAGVISAYDDETERSAPLTETAGGTVYATCSRQSVTADGTVVYQREPEDDWEGSQILLAHP